MLIPNSRRVSLVIKSGIYAEIYSLQITSSVCDAWWTKHVILNASHITFFQPGMLVLQLQLDNVCVWVGEGVNKRTVGCLASPAGCTTVYASGGSGTFLLFSGQTSHSVVLSHILDLGFETLKHVYYGRMSEPFVRTHARTHARFYVCMYMYMFVSR